MREYETIVVLRPDGGETPTNELLARLDSMIERHGGDLLQRKDWGKRELAYRVQKYKQGIYYYYNYAGTADTVSNLERAIRLHEIPMKYLTVKLNDEVDVEARKKELAEIMEASAHSAPAAAEATPVKTEEKEPVEAEKKDTEQKQEEVKDA